MSRRNRTFAAYQIPAYRRYAPGSFVSAVGTWMQRIAQDWLVLDITHGSASAVGLVTALQFLPMLLASPSAGSLADRVDRRRGLILVQLAALTSATVLAATVLTGHASLHLIYACAIAGGLCAAFEAPLRSAYLHDLSGPDSIAGVVALESAAGNLARLIGPAVAGLLIAGVGVGWAVAANAVSYLAVIASLLCLRHHRPGRPAAGSGRPAPSGSWAEVRRVLAGRGDLVLVLTLAGVVGTFGFNFSMINALMATQVYHVDAAAFGALGSAMSLGSLAGALAAARRPATRVRLVVGAGVAFGTLEAVAGTMPSYLGYAASLAVIGAASMTFFTAASSYLQLAAPAHLRGRLMALFAMVFSGGTPVGAPLIGWVAEHAGTRWALYAGGGVSALGALVAVAVFLAVGNQTVRRVPAPGRLPRLVVTDRKTVHAAA